MTRTYRRTPTWWAGLVLVTGGSLVAIARVAGAVPQATLIPHAVAQVLGGALLFGAIVASRRGGHGPSLRWRMALAFVLVSTVVVVGVYLAISAGA